MDQPLRIGISPAFFYEDEPRPVYCGKVLSYVETSMIRWVQRSGAFPVMLPEPIDSFPLESCISQVDGLILQGGSDVAAESFREKSLRSEWAGDRRRDIIEMEMFRECLRQKKPVLGVCRGAQLMNVFFGGTLYQDIATQLPSSLQHRNPEVYDQLFHGLHYEEESVLTPLFGGRKNFLVNSIHHQAIKELGNGVQVEARAEDGIIEMISIEGFPFAWGVQWHPEFMPLKKDRIMPQEAIMGAFLEACRAALERP